MVMAHNNVSWKNYFDIITVCGFYPLEQAIIMFYVKSTDDPLQIVSKLDAMTLVSTT